MMEEISLNMKVNGRDSSSQGSSRRLFEDDVNQNEKIILSINWKDIFLMC